MSTSRWPRRVLHVVGWYWLSYFSVVIYESMKKVSVCQMGLRKTVHVSNVLLDVKSFSVRTEQWFGIWQESWVLAKIVQWWCRGWLNKHCNLEAAQMRGNVKRPPKCAHHLLSWISSFLRRVKEAPRLLLDDICSVFKNESMHILYLQISKLLKNCPVGFVGSWALCTREGGIVHDGQIFKAWKVVWCGCAIRYSRLWRKSLV